MQGAAEVCKWGLEGKLKSISDTCAPSGKIRWPLFTERYPKRGRMPLLFAQGLFDKQMLIASPEYRAKPSDISKECLRGA